MRFSNYQLLLLTLSFIVVGCREPEGLIYPDDDMSIFPNEPVFFDPEVAFDESVPEDESSVPPLCPADTERLFNNTYSPYLGGDESVDLEIISISYFGCPHCADWAKTYEEVWTRREDIRNRVRIYFHHFPFSDNESYLVHGAAHAAGLQNARYFWAVHNFIYVNLRNAYKVSADEIADYVENYLDLDFNQWNQDRDPYSNTNLYHFLDWDRAQATVLGVNAVPTIFICGTDINDYAGGRDNIEAIVDSFLN